VTRPQARRVSCNAPVQRHPMAAAHAAIAPDARRFQRRGSDPLATHQNELFAEEPSARAKTTPTSPAGPSPTQYQGIVRDVAQGGSPNARTFVFKLVNPSNEAEFKLGQKALTEFQEYEATSVIVPDNGGMVQ
jgi:hypothetical protein